MEVEGDQGHDMDAGSAVLLEKLREQALAHGFTIEVTEGKGRVCVARKAFPVGTVVFEERSFVHASDLPERCLACDAEHPVQACQSLRAELGCPEELVSGLDSLAEHLCDVDDVMTLDRARCFIKCLLMLLQDPVSLAPLSGLTAVNLTRCWETARAALAALPGLFAQGLSAETAGQILAVLNTNSHTLEQLEGSGLFLLACMMEHDCQPTCSFTTYGDKIWLTCVRAVKPGEALSIDYGNNFYVPAAERQADLLETYGFKCRCKACTILADPTRAFHCPSEDCEGKVCAPADAPALGAGEKSGGGSGGGAGGGTPWPSSPPSTTCGWHCGLCGHECVQGEVKAMLIAEAEFSRALAEEGVAGVEDVDMLLEKEESRAVHGHHYAAFWALNALAKSLSQDPASAPAAEDAWQRVVEAVEAVLPEWHHEKAIYYDSWAQAKVLAGDIEGAREAYWNAYRVSAVVSGVATQPTLDIKALAEDPPADVQELVARYSVRNAMPT